MRTALGSVALCMAAVCTISGGRPGGFSVIGPGGGGAMFHPTISPHDSNTVLVACDMTGGYITHDAGRSWRMFNLRGTIRFFTFDPIDRRTMYAQATGLWRSVDDGVTWRLVSPRPAAVQGVKMDSDHADETIVADPNPLGRVAALAIDPADSQKLYAAGGSRPSASLFASPDRGERWVRVSSLSSTPLRLWADPFSPTASRVLVIGYADAVEVRSPTKTRKIPAPASVRFNDMAASFGRESLMAVYATSPQGMFCSNGQANWRECPLPGRGAKVNAVASSLRHPETAYVSYSRLLLEGKEWSGVAKTTDAGRTWNLVWKEASTAAPNVHDAWITARFGPGWGENPLMLGVAPADPNLCYGTDLGRTMRTVDGGANWQAVYSRRVPNAGWTSTGLDVTTNYGVHFDPFDRKREFITYTDIGLFRSEDDGRSWMSSTEGVPRKWLNTTYWMEFDPKVRGRAWSANSNTHDLPRPKMFRRTSVLTYQGGICVSNDGGKTWAPSNSGMEPTAPTHILLDPESPPAARVLYVAAFGRGVYQSTDSGHTWTLKNRGIKEKEPFAWRLARASDGTLYVLLARRTEDGSIGNAGDGAIYRSTDRAESWTAVTLPAGVNGPNGIVVDAADPRRLYLAAWGRAAGMHGEGGGIFLSEDGGGHWRAVLDRDQHVYDITPDPRDPKVLYAAGFESSAWRSEDRGEHWKRIPGFNFKWGQRVIPDPADRNKIYITTFGGSVWHGDVHGQLASVDIATAELEPGR